MWGDQTLFDPTFRTQIEKFLRRTGGCCKKVPKMLRRLAGRLRRLELARQGQDLVEYALPAGIPAAAAGAVIPGVAEPIKIIFVKMSYLLSPR